MPTRAGWLLLGAATAAGVTGRALGVIELYVVAAAGLLLVGLAVVYVHGARARLRVVRTVTPSRVHAGDTTRIEVAAANRSRWRTPVLALRDPVEGTRGAHLHLAPLAGAEQVRAAYRLPTSRRGVLRVGPLTVTVADPFGLATRQVEAAPVQQVTVYPRIDRIAVPPSGGDRSPAGVTTNANALGRQGDEFYALRPYVVGDDLRRVHWRSTARLDDLLVRQDELPWQDRTTVVLDVRRAAQSEASFERAVSAAASVLVAATRAGHVVRLVTSDGFDSGASTGVHHVDALLEHLARVDRSGGGSLRRALDTLVRTAPGGALVGVLGRGTPGELDALARLGRRYRSVVAVLTEPPLPAPAGDGRAGLAVVDATADGAFAAAWRAAAVQRGVRAG